MTFEQFVSLGFADSYIQKCGVKWGADELKSYWGDVNREEAIKVLKGRRDDLLAEEQINRSL